MAVSKIKGSPSVITRSISIEYPSDGIAANASFHANLKTLIDADMPNGYAFLAFAGIVTNSGNLNLSNLRYSDSVYSFEVKNISSSKVTAGGANVNYVAYKNL